MNRLGEECWGGRCVKQQSPNSVVAELILVRACGVLTAPKSVIINYWNHRDWCQICVISGARYLAPALPHHSSFLCLSQESSRAVSTAREDSFFATKRDDASDSPQTK